jgi:hypothetical protein
MRDLGQGLYECAEETSLAMIPPCAGSGAAADAIQGNLVARVVFRPIVTREQPADGR